MTIVHFYNSVFVKVSTKWYNADAENPCFFGFFFFLLIGSNDKSIDYQFKAESFLLLCNFSQWWAGTRATRPVNPCPSGHCRKLSWEMTITVASC